VSRLYRHQRARQHFSLYFLPFGTYGRVHEYLECETCLGTFAMSVLDEGAVSSEPFESEFDKTIKWLLVHMMTVDGEIVDGEVATVRKVCERFTGRLLTVEDVRHLASWGGGRRRLLKALRVAAPTLNELSRERVMQAALAVAASDGKMANSESRFIERIGVAIGMRPEKVRGAIQAKLSA